MPKMKSYKILFVSHLVCKFKYISLSFISSYRILLHFKTFKTPKRKKNTECKFKLFCLKPHLNFNSIFNLTVKRNPHTAGVMKDKGRKPGRNTALTAQQYDDLFSTSPCCRCCFVFMQLLMVMMILRPCCLCRSTVYRGTIYTYIRIQVKATSFASEITQTRVTENRHPNSKPGDARTNVEIEKYR